MHRRKCVWVVLHRHPSMLADRGLFVFHRAIVGQVEDREGQQETFGRVRGFMAAIHAGRPPKLAMVTEAPFTLTVQELLGNFVIVLTHQVAKS